MKNICINLLYTIFLFSSLNSFSQNNKIPINEPDMNKPRLFDALPSRIPVNKEDLEAIVNAPAGRAASLKLSNETTKQFNGEIVSVSGNEDKRVKSIVLRSANFSGATFTVSKILNEDGTYSFTGRIISFKHGDIFELKKEAGSYVLIKRNFYDLVNE